ncbi:unnamed protein product [Urochloa humidicola]
MGDTEGAVEVEVVMPDAENQDKDAPVNEQEKDQKKDKKRKAMAPRSDVWDSYHKIHVGGVLKKAKCKYCDRELNCHSKRNGTTSLKYHLGICKRNPNKNSDDQGTLQLQPSAGCSSVGTISTWKFDLNELRNSFAQMLIEDELPFVFTERPGLRKFMAKACPRFTVPSRRTATRACVSVYDVEKEKLKEFFKKSCERVCLTTDTWTANTQQNYMCVTAHFIDSDWNLHKKIIGFFLVKGHRGEDIGKSLEGCLAEWGIDKVFSITVDNASSNNGAIKYMRKVLNESNCSIAEGQYLHMRCVAHIINLIVTEGLKEIDVSVARVRAAVKFVKSSPTRLSKFKKCAELAKVDSKAFLSLDVCTRWNSTYLMLANAIPYEKAFERYKDDDPYYQLDLEGQNMPGIPEKSDWEKARKMAEFLEHFYELTLRVSATQHVTSHTYFHEIADVLILLREWCQSSDNLRKEMGKRMLAKYYKYWVDKWTVKRGEKRVDKEKDKEKEDMLNLNIFFCVAVDPRYKLSDYTKMATLEMFGREIGEELWEVVNKEFHALFEEYRNLYAPSDKSQQTTDSEKATDKSKRLMRSVIAQKMRLDGGGNGTTKSELEKYFAEENEEDKKDFEILEWWKDNTHRFPILSHMARDLLAIPISTVASESAFSTGGRVLDDFRSSLTPVMVERLICTQDWLRRSTALSVEEDPEELAKIEEALIANLGDLTVSPKPAAAIANTGSKDSDPSAA